MNRVTICMTFSAKFWIFFFAFLNGIIRVFNRWINAIRIGKGFGWSLSFKLFFLGWCRLSVGRFSGKQKLDPTKQIVIWPSLYLWGLSKRKIPTIKWFNHNQIICSLRVEPRYLFREISLRSFPNDFICLSTSISDSDMKRTSLLGWNNASENFKSYTVSIRLRKGFFSHWADIYPYL